VPCRAHNGAGFLALEVGFRELSTGMLRRLLGFNQFVREDERTDFPVSWVASLAARSVDPADNARPLRGTSPSFCAVEKADG
jgi:hypothetical protein